MLLLEKIISLIEENKIYEAFNEIDSINLKSPEIEKLRKEFILGLMQADFFDRLKMAVKEAYRKSPKLNYQRFECNRKEQEEVFGKRFEECLNHKFQFYFIGGNKEQSPEGLFKRLYKKYILPNDGNGEDIIVFTPPPLQKNKLLARIFEESGLNPNLINDKDFNIQKLASAPKVHGKKIVALKIKTESKNWDTKAMSELFKWFLEEFCDEKLLENLPTKFVIFFGIIYSENTHKTILPWVSKGNTNEKVIQTIHQFPKINILPDLEAVSKDEIRYWFEDHCYWYDNEITSIFEKQFPQDKKYNMGEVIAKLGEVIEKHNELIKNII